jgi:hypothetical protein
MSDFNPPAPTTIRKTPIKIGGVVDLQHEDSGREGFISVTQCWYRVGGDLNREIVVPTLAASPIGHEILSSNSSVKSGELLRSGTEIHVRSVSQNPAWPAYKVWKYLSGWWGDGNASYCSLNDPKSAKNAVWIIEKINQNGSISGPGEAINSGDKVRLKSKSRNAWLVNSADKHVGEHHANILKDTSDPKRYTWVIWSQGAS